MGIDTLSMQSRSWIKDHPSVQLSLEGGRYPIPSRNRTIVRRLWSVNGFEVQAGFETGVALRGAELGGVERCAGPSAASCKLEQLSGE